MATVNLRSIRQKSASFSDFLDVVAITETWLKADETSAALADITPQGYSLIHKPRRGKQGGGGVAIMTNNKFDVSPCKIPQYTNFESVGCKISAPLFSAHVVCIYRLIEYPLFVFDQFQNLLENLSFIPGELIILGDFNLHLDIPSHHTGTFTDILMSFGLLQHVNFPTHIHGHWLDLCITRSASQILSSIFPSDGLSEHLTVIAELQSDLHRHTAKKQITYKRINQIDINNFKTDNVKSQLITNPKLSADSLYKQFHDTLSSILNTHAPLKTKSVSPKPPNPWITPASFSTFFVNEIEKIRMKFCDPKHNVPQIPPPEINFPMTSFEPATADEVKKLILSSQDKSCDLDPLPTKLDVLSVHHVNTQEGSPSHFSNKSYTLIIIFADNQFVHVIIK